MYNPEIFFVTFIPETNSFLAHAHKILQKNLMYVAERLEIGSIILYPERNNVNIASEYKPHLEKAIEKVVLNHELHIFINELIEICNKYPESLVRVAE